MSANQYLASAKTIAQTIPGILADLGLAPLISRFVLSETDQGDVWLFIVMDDSILESLEYYAANYVLDQLSAALFGHPVVFSRSSGVRYAVLLNHFSTPSEMPHPFQSAEFNRSSSNRWPG
jgi:hypothetical protein